MSDLLSSNVRAALIVAAFTLSVLLVALAAGRLDLAIYALSFWHYLVYVLAFCFRRVPHDRFKFDGVLLKTISLLVFAIALLQDTPDIVALVVMALGFGLNSAAAARLGADRTYYGVELAGMPAKWTTAFPYSVMSHPMLFGAMLAYGGALIDAGFRENWWPLAVLHMLLNLMVMIMEARGGADQKRATALVWSGLGAGAVLFLICFLDVWHLAAVCSVIMLSFAGVLIRQYTRPRQGVESEETSA